MNVKVALLLALTLLAFGSAVCQVLTVPTPKVLGVSLGFAESDDPPTQPNGDPVEGGEFPH